MTDKELIDTLIKAAETVKSNIALYMLLIVASDRIKELIKSQETTSILNII